jgi:ribonuclease P protein component
MLPRAERLDTDAFARAFEKGRIWRHALLTIRAHRREPDGLEPADGVSAVGEAEGVAARSPSASPADASYTGPRAAFVVPRKIGKATQRNRMRRRVREMYRLSAWRQDASKAARLAGYDLIFMLGNAVDGASDEALRNALDEQLGRVAARNGTIMSIGAVRSSEGQKNRHCVEVGTEQHAQMPQGRPQPESSAVRRFSGRSGGVNCAPSDGDDNGNSRCEG